MGTLAVTNAALLALLGDWIWEQFLLHRPYPYLGGTRVLEELPVCLWLVTLISILGGATFRIARGKTGQEGDTHVVSLHIATDHSYSDRRIALQTAVLNFLAQIQQKR
jgi:hypothetical protein